MDIRNAIEEQGYDLKVPSPPFRPASAKWTIFLFFLLMVGGLPSGQKHDTGVGGRDESQPLASHYFPLFFYGFHCIGSAAACSRYAAAGVLEPHLPPRCAT